MTVVMMWQRSVKVDCYDGLMAFLVDSSGTVLKKVLMGQSRKLAMIFGGEINVDDII